MKRITIKYYCGFAIKQKVYSAKSLLDAMITYLCTDGLQMESIYSIHVVNL